MWGIKKRWRVGLFLLASICLSFSCTSPVSAGSDSLIDSLYTKGYSTIDTENPRVLGMMKGFCESVLSAEPVDYDTTTYDARYSAFVYLLCRDIGSANGSYLSDAYFARSTYKDLDFTDIVDERDLCAPNSMSNDCNVHTNVSKLFNELINDYTNINQYNLYGGIAPFVTDDDLSDLANTYSQSYFGISICGDTTVRSYPKACRMVKSFMKQTKNVLNDVRILSPEGILTTTITNNNDIFLAGLKGSMDSFVDLSYNELFYYRLFVGYYTTLLQKYPNITSLSSSAVKKNLSSDYSWSKSALSLTLRMMSDTYVAFPFHVGLSMYQEDLDGIAQQFARLAPPIFTLSKHKLKNVQTPQ